jgi:hypothetical protein
MGHKMLWEEAEEMRDKSTAWYEVPRGVETTKKDA